MQKKIKIRGRISSDRLVEISDFSRDRTFGFEAYNVVLESLQKKTRTLDHRHVNVQCACGIASLIFFKEKKEEEANALLTTCLLLRIIDEELFFGLLSLFWRLFAI